MRGKTQNGVINLIERSPMEKGSLRVLGYMIFSCRRQESVTGEGMAPTS